MRGVNLSAVMILAVAATPGWAFAQAGNTVGLVNLPGVASKETSPLQRLPKTARAWIAAEKARLAEAPRPLIETVVELEYEIGADIVKLAKRERIDSHDLIMVILFDVTREAGETLNGELNALESRGAPAAQIEAVRTRKARLDENLAEVVRGQSVVARQLSGNL